MFCNYIQQSLVRVWKHLYNSRDVWKKKSCSSCIVCKGWICIHAVSGGWDGEKDRAWDLLERWEGGMGNTGFRCPLCSVAARHWNLSRHDNLAFFCTHSIEACFICCFISISISSLNQKCRECIYFALENSN